MAVIVIRANAKKLPSTLTKLSSAGEVDPNGPKRRNWRQRNAAETYVHIADSTSHQEWLKKTVHGDDSLADFDAASTAAKHEVWLERQRNKNRSTAHAHWLNGQKVLREAGQEHRELPSSLAEGHGGATAAHGWWRLSQGNYDGDGRRLRAIPLARPRGQASEYSRHNRHSQHRPKTDVV